MQLSNARNKARDGSGYNRLPAFGLSLNRSSIRDGTKKEGLAAHLNQPCPHAEPLNGPAGHGSRVRSCPTNDERAAITRHLRELDRLGEDLAVLHLAIAEATVDDPAVRRMLPIVGVNLTVAAGLVAAVDDIRLFAGPQKLVSCFGLNSLVRQSGLVLAQHGRISRSAGHTHGPFWSKRLGQQPPMAERRAAPRIELPLSTACTISLHLAPRRIQRSGQKRLMSSVPRTATMRDRGRPRRQ